MISIRIGGSGLTAWAQPSSYSEASKAQFGAMPGARWEAGSGRYEGPEEALRLVVAKLEAAGVSVTLGEFEPQAPNYHRWRIDKAEAARDYQLDGVNWLCHMLSVTGAALLADEMGLGKTAQAAMAIDGLGEPGPVLVLAPAIACPHWGRQVAVWSGAPERFQVMSPDKFRREWAKKAAGKPSILKDSYNAVVLDEVHYYANPAAKRSKAIAAMLDSSPSRPLVVGLTGTPIQTRVRDLWNVLDLLWPGRFGKAFGFQKRYCDGRFEEIEGLDKAIWKAEGASHQEELRCRLAACMLRRTKAQVALELPQLTRDVREIELPAKVSRDHAKTARALDQWGGDSIDRLLNAVEEFKVESAVELAQELLQAGSRPLILTRTRAVADSIGLALGCPVATGDVPAHRRRLALLEGDGAAVSTIYAVTTGIDLIEFDSMIITGPDWVPSNLLQAEARIHRLGSTRPVTIYYLVGLGTIDEVIRERVIDRLELVTTLISKDGDESRLAATFSGGSDDDLLLQLTADIQQRFNKKK